MDRLATHDSSIGGGTDSPSRLIQDLGLALDQVDDGVLIMEGGPIDMPGPRILHVNQSLLALTGWTTADLVGHPLGRLHAPNGLPELLRRLAVVGWSPKRYHAEVSMRLADGRTESFRWILRSGNQDANGRVSRYLITVQPHAGKVPEPTPPPAPNPQAARLETLAQLAGGVAHDFNNALAAIIGGIEHAITAPDPAGKDKELTETLAHAEAAKGMVRRLLAYARGKTHSERVTVDPVQSAQEAVRLAAMGSNVRYLVSSSDTGVIEADPVQLLQILSNLMINARQSMPGGGTVEVEIKPRRLVAGEVKDLAAGIYVEWLVRDHGCGIPAADLHRIFDAFFTTKKEGTGIGLSSSLAIAKAHGGTLTASSQPGYGSEFRLFLPMVVDHSGEESLPPDDSHGATPFPTTGGLVIIADDHVAVRDALHRQLEAHGFEVLASASGLEAVQHYHQSALDNIRPFAVIMDLTFPGGMTGEEAAREIHTIDPDAFVVACSGFLAGANEPPPSPHFAACLPKPYTRAELACVLNLAADHLLPA